MEISRKTSIAFLLLTFCFMNVVEAQTCSDKNMYAVCHDLPVLDSSIRWNYHRSNHTLDIAYHHKGVTASNWVAWCINPGGTGMIGAQCLIALVDSTSGVSRAYTSPITSYRTSLQQGNLSFGVLSAAAEFKNNEMIIYATVDLPPRTTNFTHLWQHGDVSASGVLQMHSTSREHLRSFETIDFATGTSVDARATTGRSRQRNKNVHGVLNVVSWGIMMPLGAMSARYLKVFKAANPAWFYLHVICQSSAYIVGVGGWATGLKLGSDSPGIEHTTHRNIGITLFALATIQVFALFFRPKPDHKYRVYWNVYHHSIGYTVIGLSIANIFKGLDILDPGKKWKKAYTCALIVIGVIAICLEAWTWFVVLKRKRISSEHDHKNVDNEENEA